MYDITRSAESGDKQVFDLSEKAGRQPSIRRTRAVVRRAATLLIATAAVCGGSLVAATPASASPGNPAVTVSGHIDCGLQTADYVEYRTDDGDSGSADISESGLNQVLTKVAGREVPGLGFVTAMTYTVTLNNVPRGGTRLYLTVSCSNALGSSGFSTDFGVRRPLVGTKATRHICDPETAEVLGCIV